MKIEEKKIYDLYRFYKRNRTSGYIDNAKTRTSENEEKRIFSLIFIGYIKFMMKKVFEGFDVQLGNRYVLGVLSIRGKKKKIKFDENGKPTNLAPDFKATNELWAKRPDLKEKKHMIYHLNEHSEGITYSIRWYKDKSIIPQKFIWFYSIAFARNIKRTVPRMVRAGKEYQVIND